MNSGSNSGSGFGSSNWDDPEFTEESLNQFCEAGLLGNSINGRGYGYMMYIMRGRVAVGNTTTKDYNRVSTWFAVNCSDGW